MDADFTLGSPMATALHGIIQPKLVEYGWLPGEEDSTLFEYILAMLDNEKNEGTIAAELANDLLGLGPENLETQQFAHWLFEQINVLRGLSSGDDSAQPVEHQMESHDTAQQQDMEMDGTADTQTNIPTGPKAMRNGSGSKTPRGGRMLNNINRQMSNDAALHRVQGSRGTGRINSHSREPPKGPRSANINRGLEAMANGRGMGMGPGNMNGMNGMNGNMMGAMGGMPAPPMGGQNGMQNGMLNPAQQMALMQMYEQQAQMMQQIFSGQIPTPVINPNFQQGGRGRGKPLSERMDRSGQHGNRQGLHPSTKFTKKGSQDTTMSDSNPSAENGDGSAMDVEGGKPDASQTMCRFNTKCTKTDCPFVHQSPAAPEGTPVDMAVTCTFGAACTNTKCVGKHVSPARKAEFKSAQMCAFYPNCRDMATCPYQHPTMPPCRNGADCQTPGCKFWHNPTMCKYNPCTNRYCPFKHAEGQKQTFKDKVWVASKSGEKDKHVSERKFVANEGEEELIIPGASSEEPAAVDSMDGDGI